MGLPAPPDLLDIAVMGKTVGDGHPMSGLVTRSEVAAHFGRVPRYFDTFGGRSTSVAAAAVKSGRSCAAH